MGIGNADLLAQRPQRSARCAGVRPQVVARKIDVLPTQRRQVLEQLGLDLFPMPLQMVQYRLHVGRVPQDNGSGDQVEGACPVSLGLNPMVANPTGAVKEDRPLEGVLRLALVQLTCGAAPFFRLFDPIEGEKLSIGVEHWV